MQGYFDNLGRETIDSFNTSENRGTQVSMDLFIKN